MVTFLKKLFPWERHEKIEKIYKIINIVFLFHINRNKNLSTGKFIILYGAAKER